MLTVMGGLILSHDLGLIFNKHFFYFVKNMQYTVE